MLLDEIINLLGDEKSSLSTALLKTKILLHEIGKKDLVEWVNHELNGYPQEAALPSYRTLPSHVRANFSNIAARYSSHPIPIGHLDDDKQEALEKSNMRQSLAVLEECIETSKNGKLARHLPMEWNGLLGRQLGNGFEIEHAWCEISIHDVKGICTQVRSRLLDFLLELKGTVGESTSPLEIRQRVTAVDSASMFNNAIFGSNTTIVVGHNNVQTVHNDVTKGNLNALSQALTTIGLPADEIQNLKNAIAEDEKGGGTASFEGKTGGWFTQLLGKAAKGTVKIGVDVASNTISKALTQYMGG